MNTRFDGLRSILGNAAVAIPGASAVASPSVAAVRRAPVLDPTPDLPDLSDLDRGLYEANGSAVPSVQDRHNDRAEVFAAGTRGMDRDESDESLELDESVFGALPPPTVQQRATARPADVRSFPRSRRHEVVSSERCVSGWAAVAVMAAGLFLGGTAAMAVFHNDVAHIFARLQ